jgi:adenylyltransferase/sulfurtransferase
MPDTGSAPTCDTSGVIMPIIASVAAVQVAEALKILTGNFDALHRSLMQIDVWRNDWRKIKLSAPNIDCETCARSNFEFLDGENQELSTTLCGRDAVQILPRKNLAQIDLARLAERLKKIAEVKQNEYLIRLNVDDCELTIFQDARAIIRGTDDAAKARGIYAKYVGS